jgi:hypothetical protein
MTKLDEILADMSKWEKLHIYWLRSHFPHSKHIWRMRFHGFKPIAYCHYACEDTYIFETKEEADRAGEFCETNKGFACGWWYGLDEFKRGLEDDLEFKPKNIKIFKKGIVL